MAIVNDRKVRVSIGRTYNMGNYESLRLEVGLEEEVKHSPITGLELPEVTFQKLFVQCEVALRKERNKIMKWHEKNA